MTSPHPSPSPLKECNTCQDCQDKFLALQKQNAAHLGLIEELTEALENIKKHQEIVTPTGYKLSATWTIAEKALARSRTVLGETK